MFRLFAGLRAGCCLLPVVIALLPMVIVAALLWAVFRGSPGDCGDGIAVTDDPALVAAYNQRWAGFNEQLLRGLPATIVVTEEEATAKTRAFLLLSDAPIEDVRVCFSPGEGDVSGTIEGPMGTDVAVRLKGDVDLSKATPDARLTSIEIGALPRFMTRPFDGLVSRVVDDQLERIFLIWELDADIGDGEATITGQPD